ncbi:MAG: hypothetical protein IJ774_05835 [Selenomonadaceae bacterium]|nr:hypothetical protein [Selenomonadaceae bacterium]MBR1805896.1 hypothetical protein [Selenomonadaceae bacterium]
MTRPMKFRWRDYDDGRIRYAYFFLDFGGNPRIREGHIEDRGIALDSERLAQLVGYDCNGREVYEGDKIAIDGGKTFIAFLGSSVTLPEFFKGNSEAVNFDNLKLKEDTR